jgi:lipopolysaccharide export system protein LptA
MRNFIYLTIFLASTLISQELKVKADSFNADEKSGISIFTGHVNIVKENDELNASKVTIYTNKEHQPIKFEAQGKASFVIHAKKGALYKGKAERVVYFPDKKEYHFFDNVHLKQIDEKKEIIGEEVILKSLEGKAYAKGLNKEPVIMIFKMKEENK